MCLSMTHIHKSPFVVKFDTFQLISLVLLNVAQVIRREEFQGDSPAQGRAGHLSVLGNFI